MKNNNMKVLLGLAVVILGLVAIAHCDEESPEMKLCVKERRRALVSIKKKIEICQTSVSATSDDPSSIQGCIVKCILKQEKALDENDVLTQESFERAVENRATGAQRENILKTVSTCLENHGTELKSDDPKCGGYQAIGACLQAGIEGLCNDESLSPRPSPDEERDEL